MNRGGHALAITAVLAAGLLFAQTGPGQAALGQLGLKNDPDRITELSFVDAADLPTELPRSGVKVKFAVQIANAEGDARDYRWSAAESGGTPVTGTVSLDADASTQVDVALPVACLDERSRIEVRIDALPDPLSFWLECPEGDGA